jgi:hypothetical protein
MSFVTCEPTSSVPTQPKSTQGPGVHLNELPAARGGRIIASRTARSRPPFPVRELPIRPSTTSKLEKKARNILKATACETMPHWGTILARVRNSFFAREPGAIARNYIGFRRSSNPFSLRLAAYASIGSESATDSSESIVLPKQRSIASARILS